MHPLERIVMPTLQMTLKKKWFDMIASGEKCEEYREIKQYWASRLLSSREEIESAVFEEMIDDMREPFRRFNTTSDLLNYFGVYFRTFDAVVFSNGYVKNSPKITVQLKGIKISSGLAEWGAEHGKNYFVLRLGNVLQINGGDYGFYDLQKSGGFSA